MKKLALCLLASILAAPMLVSAAPVSVSQKSTVIYKRITPSQLSGGSSGITDYRTQCTARSVSWSAGGTCTGNIGAANNGDSLVVVPNSPATGSATFKCDGLDDRYVLQPGSSCTTTIAASTDPCSSGLVTWGVCSAPAPSASHSGTVSVTDSSNPSTGSANFICSDGNFQYLNGSCTSTSPTCTSQSKTWVAGGNTCSALTGQTNNASSATVSNTNASGNVGSATYSCSAATDTYTVQGTPTCSVAPPQTCSAQTKTWTASGQTCSATVAQTNNGSTATATSTNGNTGTAQYTCAASTNTLTATGTPSCAQPSQPAQQKSVSGTMLMSPNVGEEGEGVICAIAQSGQLRCRATQYTTLTTTRSSEAIKDISEGISARYTGQVFSGNEILDEKGNSINAKSVFGSTDSDENHICVLTDSATPSFACNNTTRTSISFANAITDVVSASSQSDVACAIKNNGETYCLGQNMNKAVDPTVTYTDRYYYTVPRIIKGLPLHPDLVAITYAKGCVAYRSTKEVYCWPKGASENRVEKEAQLSGLSSPIKQIEGLSYGNFNVLTDDGNFYTYRSNGDLIHQATDAKRIIRNTTLTVDRFETCYINTNDQVMCTTDAVSRKPYTQFDFE